MNYIEQWLTILKNMNTTTTYKVAWARAIVELAVSKKDTKDSTIEIYFSEIAHKFLTYYWNQMYFFKLKQSGQFESTTIEKIVSEIISEYESITGNNIPTWFTYAEKTIKESINFKTQINAIARTFRKDVSYRFLKSNGTEYPLYNIDRDDLQNDYLIFSKEQVELLSTNSDMLIQIIDFKWAELLEQYNMSPRIIAKVKGLDRAKIRRKSLSKFKEIFIEADYPLKDFYTDEILEDKDISIDHVIPWSFMYSDDIWNLVPTSRSHNSSKGQNKVDEAIIKRLNLRNQELLNVIKDKKEYNNLKEAIENNYLDKFYNTFRY